MLSTLKELFDSLAPRPETESAQAREHTLQLAAAVLLVEVMRSDVDTKINESFDPAQKVRMIESLWSVAYADGRLSADENHTISKIADLLHVPHGAYINAKMRAKEAAGQA